MILLAALYSFLNSVHFFVSDMNYLRYQSFVVVWLEIQDFDTLPINCVVKLKNMIRDDGMFFQIQLNVFYVLIYPRL